MSPTWRRRKSPAPMAASIPADSVTSTRPTFSSSAACSAGVISRCVRCQERVKLPLTASMVVAGKQKLSMPRDVADLDVEAHEQHDFVRRRHLQHLRPRLAAVDAELHVDDAAPRLGQVLEHQLDDAVDDVLLDLGQGAVDGDAVGRSRRACGRSS